MYRIDIPRRTDELAAARRASASQGPSLQMLWLAAAATSDIDEDLLDCKTVEIPDVDFAILHRG